MTTDINMSGIGMTSQRTRTRLVDRLREQGVQNELILEIISRTPRHALIDEALAHRAYEDTALPIGFNQTISQPYIVARMTEELLADGALRHVLEVGTGSGYQTAILSQLAERVYTVERIAGLAMRARERLNAMGYRNISFRHSDGGGGWAEKGPFDAIMVTAAPRTVPEELILQLADNGRMLVPVGEPSQQELFMIRKIDGEILQTSLEPVRFVPLLGGKS
tara:strand:+ start:329 stop:994 length:666 start_codon:yes stop_codon:yes gene_type:complete